MAPPGWESLPFDLVRRVADVFLPTNDLDYYIRLRAVCRNWRAATDGPCGPDPRFSPRRWVLVTSLTGDDHPRCLFLHVDAGRFLWKTVPMLRNYTCVGFTEDGHLILELVSRNSNICLHNPITGSLFCFPVTTAQFLGDNKLGLRHSRRMLAASASPMVLYSLFDSNSGGCIDPTWDAVFNRESLVKAIPVLGTFAGMVAFRGHAYAVNKSGRVVVVEHNCRLDEKPELTTIVAGAWDWRHQRDRAFLVDNAGEMLLVKLLSSELQVFKVDAENAVLEPLNSIGNRAIFLGGQRCLSVDAYSLPSIECNCIYYIGAGLGEGINDDGLYTGGIYVHSLNDGSRMKLSGSFVLEVDTDSPKSLARVLMEYCFVIKP